LILTGCFAQARPALVPEPTRDPFMPPVVESIARTANPLAGALGRVRLQERIRFFYEFARDPRSTGAIGPSSPELAEAMVRDMGLERADLVVELGAGTGAFTTAIVDELAPEARFMAIELNPRLAGSLEERFGGEGVDIVCGSAEELCAHLDPDEVGGVDAIISSLPWVCFNPALQRSILREVRSALRPGGRFCTFAYAHAAWLPSGVKFRRELRSVFPECEILPIVWRNLPPAFIYRCER
jgi:phospholipid N-methyltransferase